VISATTRPFYLRERSGTHCTGGCILYIKIFNDLRFTQKLPDF